MNISKHEAAEALAAVDEARGQVARITAYGYAAPFFILCGLAWLIADLFTQFAPRLQMVWPITVLIGNVLCALVIVVQSRRDRRIGKPANWRAGVTALVGGCFLVSMIAVFWPISGKQIHSLFGLAYGAAYSVLGLWLGWRLLALGIAASVLTLAAYYWLDAWYPLFMGVVVGGGMILGGLWLRKI
jgi:NADH:ubiquinone oxidoreductase subunit 6 (subunit J)